MELSPGAPSTDLPFISVAVERDRNILGTVEMFGSLSCDHCYFQLSPRKSGVGVEKERETYQSHQPGGHTGPGQQELSSQPGCAEDFSLRGSEPRVCIATSAVTRRSGLTRCGRFTSLSEVLPRNESPTAQRI